MDRIRCSDLSQRAKMKDAVLYAKQSKIRWAGHVMRMNDNRRTMAVSDWIPRDVKRAAGKPPTRWTEGKCWRSTISKVYHDNRRGDRFGIAYTKAFSDIVARFVDTANQKSIPTFALDEKATKVYKTLTKFAMVAEEGKKPFVYARVRFFDKAGQEVNNIPVTLTFNGDLLADVSVDKTVRSFGFPKLCEKDGYLDSTLYPEFS
uniref:Phage portal protein n=1 Tax=Angiostrongylus cantonensis TaxID=6313 RepID=A0A0K0D104_ANGCA